MFITRPSWLAFAAVFVIFGPAFSQVIPVPFESSGVFGSSEPTQTFLWEARQANAVLVMIPGGEGHLGLTPARTELGGFYERVLKPLADETMTSGKVHVVVFDSPDILPSGDFYPTSRASDDHLSRIESVVRYYKERYGKPVWLMGHSNGAISVSEYIRSRGDTVNGAIFSSSRAGVKISDTFASPVLFLQHRKDGCAKVSARSVVDVYATIKLAGKTAVAFNWIDGGSSEGNPCYSGYHMYFGAETQVFRAIDSFIANPKAEADRPALPESGPAD